GDEWVRYIKRQGAAGKRQTVGEQIGAKFRQKPVRASAIGGGIDEPRKRRRKLHRPIMGRCPSLVTTHPAKCGSLASAMIPRVGQSAAESDSNQRCAGP